MCAQSKFLISSTKQENRSNGIFQDSLCFNFRCVLIHFFNLNISALSKELWFMLINDISISTLKIQQKNWLTFLQCSETSKQQGLCNDFVWDDGGICHFHNTGLKHFNNVLHICLFYCNSVEQKSLHFKWKYYVLQYL